MEINETTGRFTITLNVDDVRDAALRSVGTKLAIQERELALANAEIERLTKEVGRLKRMQNTTSLACTGPIRGEQSGEVTIAVPSEMRDRVTVTPPTPAQAQKWRRGPEPWIIAALRNGPMTTAQLAAHRGVSTSCVHQALASKAPWTAQVVRGWSGEGRAGRLTFSLKPGTA